MSKIFYPSANSIPGNQSGSSGRLFFMGFFVTGLFMLIIGRLFQLQVYDYQTYSAMAQSQHFGEITLNAKRGEILVRDTHSGELSKVATNTTLDLVYVDPMVADNKIEIAKALGPLLFTEKEYTACQEKPEECAYSVFEENSAETLKTVETVWTLDSKPVVVSDSDKKFKTYTTMVDEMAATILRKISKPEVDYAVLKQDADPDLMADVINENLKGVFADTKHFLIYADPTLIPEGQAQATAVRLAGILKDSPQKLAEKLARRKVRYVFLKNKLEPEVSRKIRELNLRGVVLLPEPWRFYPESELAAHAVGFLNREGIGQYGVEGFFNTELEGKKGTIYAEKDPLGRQITVGNSEIVDAVDGDTIILTIDRIIQKKIEEILKEDTEKYHADSGQILIMNPFTGAIIAMANFPSFNPNDYSEVFTLRQLEKDEKVDKTVPIFKRNEKGKYVLVTDEDLKDASISKFIYENKFGSAVFKNKLVSEYYEPGSIFKPIVMAMALDAKEVEPQTTFMDTGPLMIDQFPIRDAQNIYRGKSTMLDVLAYSMNTGMSFVAKKLGKKLMYQYLKDFGFGEYTNIQLEGEAKGNVDYYSRWSKAQLLTTSFGQGIVVTPLQMLTAWCALANGGKLMQPYIVDSVIREGEVIKTEPQIIKRAISEEASSIITSMNINSVRKGMARAADIEGYLIAGKTGTSQIAGADGKYEVCPDGCTIASYAGYAPALEPKFAVLIKFDRPRIGENTWGSTTAAPTFGRVARFLFDYYNIQPES